MARVTIDDCTDKIESRFDLVLMASHRARQSLEGITLQVEDSRAKKFEKKTVQSLREIADSAVDPETLRTSLIGRMQSERSQQRFTESPPRQDVMKEENQNDNLLVEHAFKDTAPPSPSSPQPSPSPTTTSASLQATSFDDDVPDEEI